MKQPELGQKIADLRAEQGLTQEELVDRCNISVRTIQRIEAGEVTPRHYTLRIIMEALGQQLEDIRKGKAPVTKTLLSQMQIGWIAGICYFLIAFPEGLLDYTRWEDEWVGMSLSFSTFGYTLIKLGVGISFFFFMRGFVRLGEYLKNDLLRIISIMFIGLMALLVTLDISSLYIDMLAEGFYLIPFSICFGIMSILFGIVLIRLQGTLGNVALIAGVMEIIAGACFLFLNPLGLLFLIPAEICEILTLYRGRDRALEGSSDSGVMMAA